MKTSTAITTLEKQGFEIKTTGENVTLYTATKEGFDAIEFHSQEGETSSFYVTSTVDNGYNGYNGSFEKTLKWAIKRAQA